MSDTPESKVLVSRWRKGDQDAAKQLFDRYASRLVALARRQISQRLASRLDPEDVVQSVFRSFFGRVKAGKFRIEEQDDLGKLLVRITVNKTLRKVEYHRAAKRDPSQEVVQGDHAGDDLLQVLDRDPTPEAVVAFVDQLDHFLNQLRPEDAFAAWRNRKGGLSKDKPKPETNEKSGNLPFSRDAQRSAPGVSLSTW